LFCIFSLLATVPVHGLSKQWQITPEDDLQTSIKRAAANDHLRLAPGVYQGNFIIDKPLTLSGSENTIIDANGQGHALQLKSDDIRITNLTIQNWGDDLTEQNAGIYSDQQASNLHLENNHLQGDGFGIWLQNIDYARVYHNSISGNPKLRSADRGNGIQLSSVKHSHVKGNRISQTRDGLYVISSQQNIIEQNQMSRLRYGIHYMYSYDNTVQQNIAFNTRAGYALMSSRRLTVVNNLSHNSEDYGFLLNYITQSKISGNIINQVWTKPENKVLGRDGKGLFVYNSGYNTISNNLIKDSEIGIHLTAGSEEVKVFGNSFIDNPTQVKYVSNRKQEWSNAQGGNYWSNYLGWDMSGDLKGDIAFEPNDGIDKLLWQYPEMKVLMDSPAVIILRWVQKQFPVLKPPGVKDSSPLMRSPHQELILQLSTSGQITPPLLSQILNQYSLSQTIADSAAKLPASEKQLASVHYDR
jgi:nitrous oxidase accessory protein